MKDTEVMRMHITIVKPSMLELRLEEKKLLTRLLSMQKQDMTLITAEM